MQLLNIEHNNNVLRSSMVTEKQRKYSREYYLKNKDRIDSQRRERHEIKKSDPEYLEKRRKYARKYNRTHFAKNREYLREKRYKIRQEVLNKLGGICVKCDYKEDWRALQIDHIHGKGNAERKKITQHGLHRKILEMPLEKAKEEYQLLCANCNWIKRYVNKEHPSGRPRIGD